jgi:peroxidase
MWEVLTGRRDGNVSVASEVLADIPSPFLNFSSLVQSFKSKGLTVHDLVVLSGILTYYTQESNGTYFSRVI